MRVGSNGRANYVVQSRIRLLAQGVALKVVSEILGHSQIGIPADLYTHVLPAVRREAIDLMDRILAAQK
jgi:integrase